jgi:hypothetical protein
MSMDLTSKCERENEGSTLQDIAKDRGVPDSSKREAPLQKRRKWLVTRYLLLLLLLSIALELYNRGISPDDVLTGLANALVAVFDPETPSANIDWLAIVGGIIPILRNMIPPIVLLWLVLRLGGAFTKGVYGLPAADASEYLRTSLFGKLRGQSLPDVSTQLALSWTIEELLGGELGAYGPFLLVENGDIRHKAAHDPLVRIGGPGSMVVAPDSAVLLERAGQLTQVAGPGVYPLRRFEKVRDIVNLRPLQHLTLEAKGMSREGIPVVWPVDVHYQIDDEGDGFHAATESQPYAFAEEAVLRASSNRFMLEPDASAHPDWGDLVAGAAEGILRSIMARHPLDRLIRPLPDSDALPRREIERGLETALAKTAARNGAKLLWVDLHSVKLVDPVAQQWVERWQADWKKLASDELARAEADRVYQLDRIKAEAQEMLREITLALEPADGRPRPFSADVISLRLIETLRQITAFPRAYLPVNYPDRLIEAWGQLRGLLEP